MEVELRNNCTGNGIGRHFLDQAAGVLTENIVKQNNVGIKSHGRPIWPEFDSCRIWNRPRT